MVGMKRIAAWLVPKDLNFIQKLNRVKGKTPMNIIKQPPYPPDMASTDFCSFPKLKLPLRGTRSQSIENIKDDLRQKLKSFPVNTFKKMFWWMDYSLS